MEPKFADQLSTPAIVVDLDIAEKNISNFQSYANAHGFTARPHIKTHKLPALAHAQLSAGAIGITCQKISEAEAMLDGLQKQYNQSPDLLITYNIVGNEKLDRLKALAHRTKLSVVADNPTVINGLSEAFSQESQPLTVLVECNTGADRCGVATPEEAMALAKTIHQSAGLKFGGLMTYPPAGAHAAVETFMREAKRQIETLGIAVPLITSGGTPSMMSAAQAPVVTEYRPGTYIYNDRSLVERGACRYDDCAFFVVATVVSVPSENRAIIDAGSKTLTSDLLGLAGYGHVLGHDNIHIDQLSEEHGRLVSDSPLKLTVGDKVRIIPNHVCVVTNMFDTVYIQRNGMITESWPIAARGKLV